MVKVVHLVNKEEIKVKCYQEIQSIMPHFPRFSSRELCNIGRNIPNVGSRITLILSDVVNIINKLMTSSHISRLHFLESVSSIIIFFGSFTFFLLLLGAANFSGSLSIFWGLLHVSLFWTDVVNILKYVYSMNFVSNLQIPEFQRRP